MNRLVIGLLATSAIAFAVPALAHPPEPGHVEAGHNEQDNWSNGGASYGDFNQEYQHIWDQIQHGLSDGSYTQSQAQQFRREMQDIRARADSMNQSGRWQPRETQARLEQLHNTMHRSHSEGHAIQDTQHNEGSWNNGGRTYGDFNTEYQHIWQSIQHGLSDGSYTRRQAQGFSRAMQQIRSRASWMERNGRYDPEDTQARLERLEQTMHSAHERGHDRIDGNYDPSYRR